MVITHQLKLTQQEKYPEITTWHSSWSKPILSWEI